jgi:hypothetical protein
MSEKTVAQVVPGVVDGQAEFDADLAYLYGLAEALFAYAAPQDLLHIAAFDRDQA